MFQSLKKKNKLRKLENSKLIDDNSLLGLLKLSVVIENNNIIKIIQRGDKLHPIVTVNIPESKDIPFDINRSILKAMRMASFKLEERIVRNKNENTG